MGFQVPQAGLELIIEMKMTLNSKSLLPPPNTGIIACATIIILDKNKKQNQKNNVVLGTEPRDAHMLRKALHLWIPSFTASNS